PSPVPVWDGCVLTASNEDQARAYKLQLNARLEGGLLPRETEYVVIPDPEGKRIGSGGATLNALLEITRGSNKENPFAGKKILIIHSGGDSKRIPHYSAFGKIFSRIPRELPDGSPSTLFDEFIISLAGLPSRMKEGVLVVSGDVLLIFNHTQLDFEYPGVVGIGIKAPVMTGSQHGVYQGDEKTQRVRRFLHKQPVERLRAYGVVDQEEKVIIDSGMVWFDPEAAGTLLDLVRNPDKTINDKERKWWISEKLNLNLYGDFLFPLAEESTLPDYLREESEGQYQEDLQSARQKLWNRLHIVPFYVKSLVPAEFIHFGTTREYRDLLLTGQEEYRDLGWKQTVMSNNPGV
ncbi:MAG: L-fucokinase, partial [Atribacterota bacterium]